MNSVKSTCIRINLQNYLDKTVQRHSGNYPSVDRAEHPRKYGSSPTLLWEPEISQIRQYYNVKGGSVLNYEI